MIAEINENGILEIKPTSITEAYALSRWYHLNKDCTLEDNIECSGSYVL